MRIIGKQKAKINRSKMRAAPSPNFSWHWSFDPNGFDLAEGFEKGLADFFLGRIFAEELLGVLAGGFDVSDGTEMAAANAAHHDRISGWLVRSLERRRATLGTTHLH